jgi:hypothetical protein
VEPGQLRIDEAVKEKERGEKRIGDTKTVGSQAYVSISLGLQEELEIDARLLGQRLQIALQIVAQSERSSSLVREDQVRRCCPRVGMIRPLLPARLKPGDKGTLAKSLSVIQETSAKILGDLFPEERARPQQPRESQPVARGAGASGHASRADHPRPAPQEPTVTLDR